VSRLVDISRILEFVGSQLVASSIISRATPREKQRAYSLANVFLVSGSNITKVRWEVMHAFRSYNFQDVV